MQNYQACPNCGRQEVDAYHLYQERKLVCWFCLIKKEGGASSPISFLEQEKWFKRCWKIELREWLENYQRLPVNKNCAERCQPSAKQKWRENKEHLSNCACLKQEAQETYLLFTNSLTENRKRLEKDCQCETSAKVRVSSDDYAWCEICEVGIPAASKKRVIKNRNDPRFWGLEVKEKVLCLKCLEKFQEKMPTSKKYTFNKYVKRGY